MSKLLITTQVYENYGSPADPYWKPKGGMDYFVRNVTEETLDGISAAATEQVECTDEMYMEYVLGCELVADDYLTEFERDQLEYEGVIRYAAKELLVNVAEV